MSTQCQCTVHYRALDESEANTTVSFDSPGAGSTQFARFVNFLKFLQKM